jgi:YihY family inner membrane protein
MADASGRAAESPWAMGWPAWKAVLKRSWAETNKDNVGLIAAGVAFYGFLAIAPMLAATVLTYGLVASPTTVLAHVQQLTEMMPADAAKLVGEQLLAVVQSADGKKGLGLLAALAIALFGARNGAGAIITALNVAYEEEETRGFLRVTLTALGITLAAVLVAIVAGLAVTALGHLETIFPAAPGFVLLAGKLLSYLLLLLVGAGAAATLYRFGPSRAGAKWQWITPGSLFSAIGWAILTVGFGIYVANFGNYNATYGSLGAVVVLLTWLYLSSYILIMGAELNSELEHQTAQDTTTGAAAPIGARGSWVADHVAEGEATGPTAPALANAEPPAHSGAGTRVGANFVQLLLVKRAGLIRAAGAGYGLKLLHKGRALPGAAVLAGLAALAWATREREQPHAG